MTYKELSVGHVPMSKLQKAIKGGTLTLTKAELAGSSHKIHVHPESHAKVMKAKRAGKGVRLHITPHEVEHSSMRAGSLWSWIRDKAIPWVKKNWTVIKPVVSAAGDAIATAFPEAAPLRGAVRTLTGVGIGRRGGKLVKGSQEAKAHMARIRSKRTGGSFML